MPSVSVCDLANCVRFFSHLFDSFRSFANDLNPESFKYLNINQKLNRVSVKAKPDRMLSFFACSFSRSTSMRASLCAPLFVRPYNSAFCLLAEHWSFRSLCVILLARRLPNRRSHVPMNLPASAIEFLGAYARSSCCVCVANMRFRRCVSRTAARRQRRTQNPAANHPLLQLLVGRGLRRRLACGWWLRRLLAWCTDSAAARKQRIRAVLGVEPVDVTFHRVRDVAPRKLMICTSFPLPMQVALEEFDASKRKPSDTDDVDAAANKRRRVE